MPAATSAKDGDRGAGFEGGFLRNLLTHALRLFQDLREWALFWVQTGCQRVLGQTDWSTGFLSACAGATCRLEKSLEKRFLLVLEFSCCSAMNP